MRMFRLYSEHLKTKTGTYGPAATSAPVGSLPPVVSAITGAGEDVRDIAGETLTAVVAAPSFFF